jgi:short-subunit dehydrogenase
MAHRTAPAGLAVVTGASSGIGAALALALSRRGQPVLAVARRTERLHDLSDRARAQGGAVVHVLGADVADRGAAERIRARARELGPPSLLVNNAGFGAYGPFEEADPARLAEMVRTNCEAVVLLTHALLPELRATRGAILNVASAAAFQPTPFMAVYGASKAFVLSFSEGLAEELRPARVAVAAFCPGPVSTEFGEVAGTRHRFHEVPGRMSADEAAREALAQLGSRAVVHVPGPWNKLATGAGKLLPRAIVRRVSARVLRPARGGKR